MFLYHETGFISHPRANKMWSVFPVMPRDQTCFHGKHWAEIIQRALLSEWTTQLTVFLHESRVLGLRQTQMSGYVKKKKRKTLRRNSRIQPVHRLLDQLSVQGKLKCQKWKPGGLGALCKHVLTHTPSPTKMNLWGTFTSHKRRAQSLCCEKK